MSLRPITMTVYLFAEEDDNPHKWNVAEWLDEPTVVGWDIEDGHGECEQCKQGEDGHDLPTGRNDDEEA